MYIYLVSIIVNLLHAAKKTKKLGVSDEINVLKVDHQYISRAKNELENSTRCRKRQGVSQSNKGLCRMYPNQSTANFDIKSTTNQYPVEKLFMSDNFTEQCFEVFIQRKSNVFLVTLYLPSVSLVILTWVNFWIDPKAIPARSGLSITAILAQITLIVGMASRFPSVSDLKTADLYVTVNFIYTFGALIEFAIVSYVPRKTPNKNNLLVSPQISSSSLQNYQPGLYVSLNSNCDAPHSKDPKKFIQMNSIRQYPIRKNYNGICWRNHPFPKMRQVKEKKPKKYTGDDISKIIFPVSFTIWNILFFTVNLYLAET